jgi:hypothetical protein
MYPATQSMTGLSFGAVSIGRHSVMGGARSCLITIQRFFNSVKQGVEDRLIVVDGHS